MRLVTIQGATNSCLFPFNWDESSLAKKNLLAFESFTSHNVPFRTYDTRVIERPLISPCNCF